MNEEQYKELEKRVNRIEEQQKRNLDSLQVLKGIINYIMRTLHMAGRLR